MKMAERVGESLKKKQIDECGYYSECDLFLRKQIEVSLKNSDSLYSDSLFL